MLDGARHPGRSPNAGAVLVQAILSAVVAVAGMYLLVEHHWPWESFVTVVLIGVLSGAVAGSCFTALAVPTLALVSLTIVTIVGAATASTPNYDEGSLWILVMLFLVAAYLIWCPLAAIGVALRTGLNAVARRAIARLR